MLDERLGVDDVWLRPMAWTDFEAFLTIHHDPAANQYTPSPRRGRDQERARLAEWIRDWDERGIGYWTLLAGSTTSGPSVIGFGGVRYIQAGPQEVFNLYYRFIPAMWGRGYATRLGQVAREHAARHDPRTPVIARMLPSYRRSERVALRVGLAHIGSDRGGLSVLADRPLPASVLNGLSTIDSLPPQASV